MGAGRVRGLLSGVEAPMGRKHIGPKAFVLFSSFTLFFIEV